MKTNRRNNGILHTLPKQPPSMDGGSWLTAVGSLLLAGGVSEGATSLSMVVLNSMDWSEIIWLMEISCFKINLAIGFI